MTEIALAVALLGSLIVNLLLVEKLKKANEKLEEVKDERKW